MGELVEWRVIWTDEHGTIHNASDGAQSIFGLTRAKDLAKRLGPPWQAVHRTTMLPPDAHQAEQSEGHAPTFGSPWAP